MRLLQAGIVFASICILFITAQRKQRIVAGNSKITFSLLNILGEKPGNVFFSPLSLEQAIGMVYLGASGKTAGQIKKVFLLEGNKDNACTRFKNLVNSFQKLKSAKLEMANRVYVANNFEILPSYLENTEQCFHAKAENVDFSKNVETAELINSWVESVTHEKIKNLINPDELTSLTKLVLVNGIYFKGEWMQEFTEGITFPMDFYLANSTSSVKVEMMSQTTDFLYAEIDELGVQILEMPYKGDRIVMLVVLPKENGDLSDIIPPLLLMHLDQLRSRMTEQLVRVRFPRFKMETEMHLNQPLKELGVTKMFDDADLSLMSAREGLYVSFVVQKTFLECNEKGSEAAAATGIGIIARSGSTYPEATPKFYADHPFLFFILDKKTEVVLFAGKLENPTQ